MTAGIVGLGLIGGSFAKAYHENQHKVLAFDANRSVYEFAMMSEDIDGELNAESIKDCDIIIIAVYPRAAVTWFENNAKYVRKDALVIDACGIKSYVCERCFAIAEKYGITFIGGHPMAGTHHSGFKYARDDLFKGAPMVIVPPRYDDIELLARVEQLLLPCGFGRYSLTSAKEHDRVIAFTSQLPHVVSNAFIKSPTSRNHSGFSAGSYKDLTRVAQLNPYMWTELFIENKEFLLEEINGIISSLTEYRDALEESDSERLIKLLDDGRRIKEEVDGK